MLACLTSHNPANIHSYTNLKNELIKCLNNSISVNIDMSTETLKNCDFESIAFFSLLDNFRSLSCYC